MSAIRTLLVDDNQVFLDAVKQFFITETSIEVIGAAYSGDEALEKVIALQPDLVLMDYVMPGMNGVEATRHIKTQPNPPKVIVLTLHDNLEYQRQAVAARADGFVAKARFGSELLPLINILFSESKAIEPAHLEEDR